MDSLSWISITLYAGIVQGLFMAFLLPRITKANAQANRTLSVLLITASLWVILYLNTIYDSHLPLQAHILLDTFAFLFGPLFYLYLTKLLFHTEKIRLLPFHFMPAGVHFLYAISKFNYSQNEFSSLAFSGAFRTEWLIIFSMLMIVIFGYWIGAVRLLTRFKKLKHEVVLFKQNLRYIKVFLAAIIMGYSICIIFSLDFFFGIKIFAFTGPNIGWIIMPMLVYFISYLAILQPEVMRINFFEERKTIARISKEEVLHYKSKLEELMKAEKIYLQPLLKLNDIAEKIELDTTRLSWLINAEYGCNFYDFINKYRVDEFMKRLKNNDHKHQTLESIAYEVGFNSKTTFNKSFKRIINRTPSEYVRNLKAAPLHKGVH